MLVTSDEPKRYVVRHLAAKILTACINSSDTYREAVRNVVYRDGSWHLAIVKTTTNEEQQREWDFLVFVVELCHFWLNWAH